MSRSLRSRILLGSILWTIGLFGARGHGHDGGDPAPAAHAIVLHLVGDVSRRHRARRGRRASASWPESRTCGSGLSPIDQLRGRLSAVRDGSERRFEGRYPTEVQPLVDDLNALLEHRDQTVKRAIAKAGDLAHALKTPLAVLAHEAEVADTAGQGELAAVMRQQIERMRRQMDYHLAHARAAASGRSARRTVLRARVGGRARPHAAQAARRAGLAIEVDVDAGDTSSRVEREDLDEMLGNLLDNACKWARSRIVDRVRAAGSRRSSSPWTTTDLGWRTSMREVVLQRGVRADEAAPGSGLGLAIVRDLAELYGGSIVLSRSPAGGLRARLQLPGRARGAIR